MDILAQRKSVGALSGVVMLGKRPVGKGYIRKTAYVPQVRQVPGISRMRYTPLADVS